MNDYKLGDILTINGTQYSIKSVSCRQEKVPLESYMLGLKVGIEVRRLSDNQVLKWEDIRGSYLAEKITDFVHNTINGQRTLYWNWNKCKVTELKYKIGDVVTINNSSQTCKVKNITEAQVDIYGTNVKVYELEGKDRLYVDIYDGTVSGI